ncbi:MAG: hypothetical protein NT167_29755 [Verrucomicrobia bacterium]|nr:hypothetical protein [Verrucomicrobiota bacterium]
MNPWGMTIGMVGMTAQNLWHKHLCDPDRAYLEAKIYPSLREAARFYLSFMKQCHKDADGKILLGPSYSPEHGAMGIDNCPFDIAYVHYTFDAFDKASKELGKDRSLAAECLAMKALLADYPVALDPDGKPVVVDWTGCKYREVAEHNLTVPAAPVFPAEQVTWFSPEPVKELFHRTIQDTKHNGNNSHVVFNIAKARLSMPEAVPDTKAWFKSRELPNGLFVWQGHQHGTFMPESIGVAAIVTEFLMQSVGDIIRVFPCWPKEQDAKFTNLRAQGGFLISAEQKDGKVTKLEVTSTVGGTLRLLNPWTGRIVERTTQPGQKLAFTGAEERTRAPKKAPAGGFLVALGGEWRLELDRQDVGVKEKWFTRDLSQRIQLPGSMSGNGLGDPITGIVQHAWDKVIDQPTWHPMLKHDYRGAAWYQQSVTIPQAWQEKIIELSLERVCWQSELWVDDIAVGRCDSLSAPHCYELGVLKPGTHRLTLRIDNRKLCELGLNTHAYHEQV